MKRYIYAFDTIDAACSAAAQLRERGFDDRCISLIARGVSQPERTHDRLVDASADLIPIFGRGAVVGGTAGLCASIVAMLVLPLDAVIAGSMAITFLASGALLGAWVSTPIGPRAPEGAPRALQDEVEAGRTLLVVDSDSASEVLVASAMDAANDHLIWQSVKHTASAQRTRSLQTKCVG
jgi:hypothetical protein